jgi:hypothetical protein
VSAESSLLRICSGSEIIQVSEIRHPRPWCSSDQCRVVVQSSHHDKDIDRFRCVQILENQLSSSRRQDLLRVGIDFRLKCATDVVLE